MSTAGRTVSFTSSSVLAITVVCFLLLAPIVSFAQTGGTGSIEGTVTDPSGSVIAGAVVSAVNTATGVATQATSTGTGRFVISLLQPGTYDVNVTSAGFAPLTQRNVVVAALQNVALNPQLALGTAAQSVTVTDAPPVLQTEDLKIGSNINNETYDALPLAMNQSARDPSAFIGLAVGVNNFTVQAAGPTTASFNGGQPYQNETYFEGLPLTSAGTESDTRNFAFGVSVEAVDQFQVATTGADATFEGQGVTNFIVKAGTSHFHGGVFEYFRNTVFDAKNFFTTNRSPEHQNEFGGNIGGPILRNKLFFFANYDGYRFSATTLPTQQNIPTLKERNGDFSEFPNPIYDPTACLSVSGSGACTSRRQFSYNGVLNVIPPSRLSAVSQSFQSYLPNPTSSGITLNYLAVLSNQVFNDDGTLRIDYDMSKKNRVYGIFTRGKYSNPIVGSLGGQTATTNSALPVPYTDGRGVIEYTTMAQLHDAYVISPNVVNDFGYGLSRLFIPLTSNTGDGNYPSKAGLKGLPPGIAATGFPDVTFNGNNPPVNWDGTNSHAFTEWQTTFTVQDNILWTKGRHHFTFGYQWQALQDNENTPLTGTQAGFTFGPNETANFNSSGAINTATGLSYASYLLGSVDSSSVVQNAVAETGGRYKTNAAYIQDNIQVTPNLTINAGLRWDVWSPFTEVNDHMSFFNPNLPNPVAGNILGALQFAGSGTDSCGCHTPVKQHWLDFGPRFGIAYQIGNNTAIRAAYGMFYAHAGGVGGRTNGRQGLSQIGFNSTGNLSSTVTGQPAYTWDNGVPGNPLSPPFLNPSYGIGFISASAPGAAAVGAGPSTAQTLVYGDPEKGAQPPQYQDFYLNVQRSFGSSTTLSLAYSGSVGRYLPGAGVAGPFTNQIPVKYLPLGSILTQTLNSTTIAAAAALGFTVTSPFPNFTGTVGQALKPYPQYNNLSNPWLDVGNSNYHSLQASLNRRMTGGLTYMINYTLSKEMDDLAGVRYPGADYLEYSVGTIDHRHVLSTTVVYSLPFGKGRRFSSDNLMIRNLIGGWQISGIFTEASGAPLNVTGTCTGGGIIDAVCIPNMTPGFSGSARQSPAAPTTVAVVRSTSYLNKAAFQDPAAYTIGNAARNAPYGLYAPHVADVDLSIRREFGIYESLKLIFQADAFNLPNRVYFAAPGTGIDSANFGQYSNQANQARKLQLSTRVNF